MSAPGTDRGPAVVVIGGGHNGLVAAALLAKAGVKVMVLESRNTVGGAATTEEIHPGFRVSAVAHATGPLRPSLLRELGIALEMSEAEPRVFAPLPDGRGLAIHGDPARTAESISTFSARDAERYPAFHACLTRLAGFVARVLEATPPEIDAPGVSGLVSLARLGLGLRGLGRIDGQRLLRFGPMAVADFAAEWFESEPLRAVVCGRGIFGAFAGPWSAGTTANLLLQAGAAGSPFSSVWPKGGLGALSEALAAAARRFGAEVRTGAEVARLLTQDGRVTGVALASGEELKARAVVSAVDPQHTFLHLLDPVLLDPEDLRRVRSLRLEGMAAKVNLALSALPAFPAARGDAGLLRGRIHLGADVDTLERAFDDAKYGRPSQRPWLEATIPSLADPALAPQGAHVMSVYVQFAPRTLREGDWDAPSDQGQARRDELAQSVLSVLEEHAPGLRGLVVARQVLTPLDLERTYGLTGGHPHHGEPSLGQLFVTRPLIGWGRYRGPLPGLYLCSAGTHGGLGVTGGPGCNAARELLRDLR